jgi:hypothetical protein
VRYACRLPAFKKLSQRIQEMPEFGAWLQQGTPEQCVPQLWEEERQLSPVGSAMYQLLVIQVSLHPVPSKFANLLPFLMYRNVVQCRAPKMGLVLNKKGLTGLQDGWLDIQGSIPTVGKDVQNANWSYMRLRWSRGKRAGLWCPSSRVQTPAEAVRFLMAKKSSARPHLEGK